VTNTYVPAARNTKSRRIGMSFSTLTHGPTL
jgi:hypothetical protein